MASANISITKANYLRGVLFGSAPQLIGEVVFVWHNRKLGIIQSMVDFRLSLTDTFTAAELSKMGGTDIENTSDIRTNNLGSVSNFTDVISSQFHNRVTMMIRELE